MPVKVPVEITLLTTEDVAFMLQRSTRTVQRHVAAGKLHPVKVGNTPLFQPLEVKAILLEGNPEDEPEADDDAASLIA